MVFLVGNCEINMKSLCRDWRCFKDVRVIMRSFYVLRVWALIWLDLSLFRRSNCLAV